MPRRPNDVGAREGIARRTMTDYRQSTERSAETPAATTRRSSACVTGYWCTTTVTKEGLILRPPLIHDDASLLNLLVMDPILARTPHRCRWWEPPTVARR